MTTNTRISALALILGAALTLGACGRDGGSGEAGSGTSVAGTTAQVTFTSEPNADVWIDGKLSGRTP